VRTLMRISCLAVVLAGCLSGAGEVRWPFPDQYRRAQQHREALAHLHPGMSQAEVRVVMGDPEMAEGQPRRAIWLYRTAVSNQAPTGPEADFTPLVFDEQERLVGWGREVLPARAVLGAPSVFSTP
jgi:outer membrane protein assembly factor BamE (lipoprotein component of BamABCDE complex)